MRKVVVVGSGGSGKSTFSRRLGAITGLPVIHLDKLHWRPNWTPTPKDEWEEIVRRELERDSWIMDGNFGGTREMRMKAADTIIFLDMPRLVCTYRVLKRTLLYRKANRPDMADGCSERFDWEFLMWVWNYPSRSRNNLLDELEKLGDKRVIVLKSRQEVASFLRDCSKENTR